MGCRVPLNKRPDPEGSVVPVWEVKPIAKNHYQYNRRSYSTLLFKYYRIYRQNLMLQNDRFNDYYEKGQTHSESVYKNSQNEQNEISHFLTPYGPVTLYISFKFILSSTIGVFSLVWQTLLEF